MLNQIKKPVITVIIATYNRPQVLVTAIKSVRNQIFKDWVLYVIGDNCSQSTQDLMDTISDDRITYYNNPFRFGEQSGGNNIGTALAQTEYIAILNHDDLWTPDHLEIAISNLKKSEKEFYIGRAIMSRTSEDSIPIFKIVNPIDRKPDWAFRGHYMLYEPCSSWVIKTKKAKEIGYWKRKIDAGRTPVQEYIMSAWHKKTKFYFGEKITCAYLTHHNNKELHDKEKSTAYAYPGYENEYVYDLFFNKKEEFQKLIETQGIRPQQFRRFGWKNDKSSKKSRIREVINRIILNRYTAYFYYFTGIDFYTTIKKCMKSQKRRIMEKQKALLHKTGNDRIEIHNMDEVIAYTKEHFHQNK